jgi:hypothetical protein
MQLTTTPGALVQHYLVRLLLAKVQDLTARKVEGIAGKRVSWFTAQCRLQVRLAVRGMGCRCGSPHLCIGQQGRAGNQLLELLLRVFQFSMLKVLVGCGKGGEP